MKGRIVLAGASSNVGKTSIAIGMMKAFVKQGLEVQPFKVGPDYIDPAFHTYVTGNISRNLDYWMLGETHIKSLLSKNMKDADIAIIEGVMGLYDGIAGERINGSTAHVAKILNAPVVLIIDGSGMSTSAAAVVMGYQHFDPQVNIAGVIINKVSGQRHYELLKEVIEAETGIPCLGYVQKNEAVHLGSRHLGLVPCVETGELDDKIENLADMIEETLDLEGIVALANGVKEPLEEVENPLPVVDQKVRIGIARDKAFNFYYQDNLELLEGLGAELVPFSPLSDHKLPNDLQGLYLGGGFPEVFAPELSSNMSMKNDIKAMADSGMPIYAECGGFMYLNKCIKDFDGKSYDMVGIFKGEAEMTKRLQRFGYVDVAMNRDSVIGSKDMEIRGHEFHRSLVAGISDDDYIYDVRKERAGKVIKTWRCGANYKNVVGGYAHIHFYNNMEMAKQFVMSCDKRRNSYD